MKSTRTILVGLAAAVMFVTGTMVAQAQFPEKPITIVVPWGAGGGSDLTTRLLAQAAERQVDVRINVVNRPGAGGLTGMDSVANAAPDGYTLSLLAPPIGKFAWLGQSDITYEDFAPIVQFNFDPGSLLVAQGGDFPNAQSVIDAFKNNPDAIGVSGGGRFGAWHLALLETLIAADVDLSSVNYVPFDSSPTAVAEVAAGALQLSTVSLPEAAPLIEAGRIEAVAVLNDERVATFPDVPTIGEATGINVVAGAWRGLAAPAGIPDDVASILQEMFAAAFNDEEFQSSMKQGGFGLRFGDAEQFGALLQRNHDVHGEALKALGEISDN